VELVCCIDIDLPSMVLGDAVCLQQILYNLVGNAVKFTGHGRVCVEADRSGGSEALPEPHILFGVGDTGIVIAQDQLDCIFDTFWQADASTSRRYGGTGPATAIARRLMDAMGGAIEARSVESEGTTFDVRLLLLGTQASECEAPCPPAMLGGRHVVVCEPEPEGLDALVAARTWPSSPIAPRAMICRRGRGICAGSRATPCPWSTCAIAGARRGRASGRPPP